MPVSVTIEPFTPSIDMYDSPDTSSAYSLSGHITIAASSSSSLLGLSRSSAHNLILSSLELTFEGQSELLLTDVGYMPLRIISITKQLVSPSHPVQITADEDHAEWRVVFNLAIPGWLPATIFGEDDERDVASISYALYARARFHPAGADTDDAPLAAAASTSPSSMWNNLCAVVRLGAGRPKVIQAEKVPIRVTRYVSPPTRAYSAEDASPPAFPRSTFAVQALSECTPEGSPSTNIPAEILRSVELHTVVPSRTSVEDDSIPLLLRLRCRLDNEAHGCLRVIGFEANIIQAEEFHTSPSPSYISRYPIPSSAQQPPNKPLRSTHPIGTLFDLGLIAPPPLGKQVVNERSIVPDGTSKHFRVRGADEDSGNSGVPIEDGWLRMEVDVPVSPGLQEGRERQKGKLVAGTSPFLNVRHEMRVRLTVGYEQPGGREGEMATLLDELAFVVPLEFVLVTPSTVSPLASTFFPVLAHMHQHSTSSLPLPHPPMTPSHSPTHSLSRTRSLSSLSSTDASLPSMPFPSPPLPAYNQLFYENGDRKDNIQITLPLYREKEEEDVHSYLHSPLPQHPRRALSASSSSTRSSSSLSSSTVSSLEHIGASEMFTTPMGISVPPPPRLERLAPPPGPPISPRTPLTPPGLAGCRLPTPGPAQGNMQGKNKNKRKEGKSKETKRENLFGESFLRFDEDDEDRERNLVHDHGYEPEVVADEHVFEERDLDSMRGEIQYGIAL